MRFASLGAARSKALLFGAAAPLLLVCAFGHTQESSDKGQTAAQKYKNIKVLKNLPADQLIPVMRRFNAALGVECTFCHIRKEDHTGWELDTKPEKLTARRMILLTEDLNKHQRSIEGKATCFMCHHGQHEPQTRPEGEGEGERRGN
jgi:hypothetical protein